MRKGEPESAKPKPPRKPKISLAALYHVPVNAMWDLWTTKKGLELWWGPVGFKTKVSKLDVTPGGEFEYAMTATHPTQIAAMTTMGMPLTSVARGTYVEVAPPKHLSYKTVVDFIPEVEPYDVLMEVDFEAEGDGTKMTVNEDVMHDIEWTQRSAEGLMQQFDKLAKFLGQKPPGTEPPRKAPP